ncbi:hypothetical protein MD535_10600 [Vibrio sp. ZSDZ65]|uniref:Uncharacterized protein n=1 Tax=Vibrio qingdaonensis TaxID=2829491 RepID=A0A9X3CN89_9VIBR|nr:hypothetical protein [Vibrio qingdaonensis]MCW8346450.1 hypothetical protein [Vibrio qingdaonensis]
MKSKLLTFSICLTMSSGAWSAPDTAFSTKENRDYFGFSTGYQPTNDYFSANVIYGAGIAPALVVETRLGYNNTLLNSKHMLARVSLFGHSQFSSGSSFLFGPFIQYEDETNPFRTGFSGVVKHQLDSDIALFGGISAVVKKESTVRVLPEFILGITWALSASEPVRTRTLELQPTTSKQPIEEVVVPSALPPQRDIIEATHVFKVNSSYITNEKVLKESIQYLHERPNMNIRIVNKHSKGGTIAYNKWLTKRREERLRAFYVRNGITGNRVEIRSNINQELILPLIYIQYHNAN